MPSLNAMSFGKVRRLLNALDDAHLTESEVDQLLQLDDPEYKEHRRDTTSTVMRWWVDDLKKKLAQAAFTSLAVDYESNPSWLLNNAGVDRVSGYERLDLSADGMGAQVLRVGLVGPFRPAPTTSEVDSELANLGLRAANPTELLAYAAKLWDGGTPVAAIGQRTPSDTYFVGTLAKESGGRGLQLWEADGYYRWGTLTRFLAVAI